MKTVIVIENIKCLEDSLIKYWSLPQRSVIPHTNHMFNIGIPGKGTKRNDTFEEGNFFCGLIWLSKMA